MLGATQLNPVFDILEFQLLYKFLLKIFAEIGL